MAVDKISHLNTEGVNVCVLSEQYWGLSIRKEESLQGLNDINWCLMGTSNDTAATCEWT